VTDASGKRIENARIDHIGKMVVVAATELAAMRRGLRDDLGGKIP
jgi:hypothetical protein